MDSASGVTPPTPIAFRTIKPGDDQAVRDLYKLVQIDHAAGTGDPAILAYVRSHVEEVFDEDFSQPHAYYSLPGHAFWVAEAGGALVGMAGIERCPGVAATARLRHVMVHPQWRRNGVASTILGITEQWCLGQGYEAIRLSTTEVNDVAVGIYLRRGYVEVERSRGVATMTITMQKDLRRMAP